MNRLLEFSRDRKLVSIRRGDIDENAIQGFILGFSDHLVLIQYVFDFILDGLMVLRRSDITDIKCSATDEFQKELLVVERLFQRIPFEGQFNLHDWKSIIDQFSKQYELIILEDERPEVATFLIGKVQRISKSSVSVEYFSGVGNWDEKPSKIAFANISSCQVNTNYINVYQRHFERSP